VRQLFLTTLSSLYPEDSGCSEHVLKRFMVGKYPLTKRPKWKHAIHETSLKLNKL